MAASGKSLPWPAPKALLGKFVGHHFWDPEKWSADPDHGMPADVDKNHRSQGFLKSTGPHAPATMHRQLANWSTLTKWQALDGRLSPLPAGLPYASPRALSPDPSTQERQSLRDLRDRAIVIGIFPTMQAWQAAARAWSS